LHLYAALAEKKRALIAGRTKSALAAARAKGVKLGNPNIEVAQGAAVAAVKAEADRAARTSCRSSPKSKGQARRRCERSPKPSTHVAFLPHAEGGGTQ
jgi:DNA invertase Pin-like site-specific DNA recombinase